MHIPAHDPPPPPCPTRTNPGLRHLYGLTHIAPHPRYYTQIRIEKAVVEVQMLQQVSSQANQEAATMPIEITPPGSPLQRKFEALVMCNFTPRKPSTLPVSRWVSCANTAARTGDYRPAPHLSLQIR